MKIALIDNYDSFTYNLVHIVNELLDEPIIVMRNDQVNYDVLDSVNHIILSPGPGIPDEAGDLKKIIKLYSESKHIFGVCLGHQAIGEVFGADLYNLDNVFHGKRTLMHKTEFDGKILSGLPNKFYAGRYHSWAVKKESNISNFNITALDDDQQIMAMQHKNLSVHGVQFHPESIMTEFGKEMIQNFINL
jgi:anthranilate synthase component II